MQRVGLIGVGMMGHGIGKNILAKGYPLTVMAHRNRGPVESLIAKGAKEAKTPKEIAQQSDIVILVVTASPQVEETVLGENGLLAGLHKGMVVADCSTAQPDSTIKVAEAIAAKGGRFVDTPMVRTPKEAEEGRLVLMTGGDRKTLEEIKPVLECFAELLIHAGPVGAAHKLKLINNFVALGTAAVAAEGLAAAAKAGVDLQALCDIVMSGGGNSVMFERLSKVALADDDSMAKFHIDVARKDLRYYTNMTETLPMTSYMAEATHQFFVMASVMGFGDRYVPRLVDVLGQLNGVTVRKQ
jgi:3-hydroxyisobutyrate dehydrogenase-like beta-hydroxyacid dehydrogenase